MIDKTKKYIEEKTLCYVVTVLYKNQTYEKFCVRKVLELPKWLQVQDVQHCFNMHNTHICNIDGIEVFIECVEQNSKLYIFGGGTVALPLSKIAVMIGFDVVILDDRQAFANPKRFPWVKETVCKSFKDVFERYNFAVNAYYILVTRGHLMDEFCLRKVLEKTYAYIGMIGSKRKVLCLKENMVKDGYDEAVFNQIHAPIGLPIHSNTPEEIAVSICAELILEKNKRNAQECDASFWLHIKDEVMMVATILEHKGSTPRGTGSKMIVNEDGSIIGTIGGGMLEFDVIKMAKEKMYSKTSTIMDFHLTNEDASKAGMVCGGQARVLLEPISAFYE